MPRRRADRPAVVDQLEEVFTQACRSTMLRALSICSSMPLTTQMSHVARGDDHARRLSSAASRPGANVRTPAVGCHELARTVNGPLEHTGTGMKTGARRGDRPKYWRRRRRVPLVQFACRVHGIRATAKQNVFDRAAYEAIGGAAVPSLACGWVVFESRPRAAHCTADSAAACVWCEHQTGGPASGAGRRARRKR